MNEKVEPKEVKVMLIFKEKLPTDTLVPMTVGLPFSSTKEAVEHILKVDIQNGLPVMWYQADNDTDGKIGEENTFVIIPIGTGHLHTGKQSRQVINRDSYIGTALLYGGELVLHYFIIMDDPYESECFRPSQEG